MSAETEPGATQTEDAPEEEAPAAEPDELREGLVSSLRDALGDAVVDSHVDPGVDVVVRISSDGWGAAGDVARNRLGARYFTFLSAIDWMPSPFGRSMDSAVDRALAGEHLDPSEEGTPASGVAGGSTRFQVFARVAHVGEQGNYWGITLKVDVPDDTMAVESWATTYAGADWHERETWEMFGISFVGHPGLRHIYLPSDFEGHPLRKDFPLLARMVKPWPGIVDVEPMPTDDEPPADAAAEGAGEASDADGGEGK